MGAGKRGGGIERWWLTGEWMGTHRSYSVPMDRCGLIRPKTCTARSIMWPPTLLKHAHLHGRPAQGSPAAAAAQAADQVPQLLELLRGRRVVGWAVG